MATLNANNFTKLGIVSTLVDAAIAFARGDVRSGAVLLGAAALSSRVPGLGLVTSLALRLYRRLR